MSALAARYKAPEWAFLPQVSDATGFAKVRTADALAMSLWPSRGLHLHGFEVKQSRTDWLKELKDPAKAESVCRYCHFWWVAVGDLKIVADGEIPPIWGLLVPKGKGLAISKQAPLLTPLTMETSFLAAMLRRAAEYVAPKWVEPVRQLEQDELTMAYEKGISEEKARAEHRAGSLTEQLAKAKKSIDEFEKASGIWISEWGAGKIGEAVTVVMDKKRRGHELDSLRRHLASAERDVEHFRKQVGVLEKDEVGKDVTQ